MIDRGDAVNLARNVADNPGIIVSTNGIACLADAVLRMDEYIRFSEAEQPAPQRYSFMLVSAQTPMGATIQSTTDHLGEWVKWEDVASLFDKHSE